MHKFWIILSHTYLSKVKAKPFIISTVLTLLVLIAFANIQSIGELFSSDEEDQAEKIALIDRTDTFTEPLQESLAATDENVELVSFEGSEEEAREAVSAEEYALFLEIGTGEDDTLEATFYTKDNTTSGIQSAIGQQLQQLKIAYATQQAGVDQETITQIYEPMPVDTVMLDETAKTEQELSQARGIVYVMLFLLYMSVIIYGQMIATDVATEKSSRVMELLISSASPTTHMFAKIIAIALVGLTQVGLFIGVGYALIVSKQDELVGGFFEFFGIQDTSPSVYIYAIVFYLLGYLLYATLAAMLGSLVSRIEDVNQLITPMILLIMAAFFIAMFGLGVPESTLVTVTSFIPFFAPMIMFLRVGMLEVPFWEVALSIGLLVGTIAILAYVGAKVYSGGVLMYGRSGSLKDFKKALALSKKEK